MPTFYKSTTLNNTLVVTDAATLQNSLVVTGNVGIGTAAPSTKLEVNGTTKATNLQINDVTYAFMPRGGIIMWYGSIVTIPTGWTICDGTNGSPDLRNRFVLCAGSTYAVAATGGSATCTLATTNMPAHTHTGTTDGGGSHNHGGSTGNIQNYNSTVGTDGSSANNIVDYWANQVVGSDAGIVYTALQHTHSINTEANHTHTFTTASTGSGTAFNTLPPYYALAYIMKL